MTSLSPALWALHRLHTSLSNTTQCQLVVPNTPRGSILHEIRNLQVFAVSLLLANLLLISCLRISNFIYIKPSQYFATYSYASPLNKKKTHCYHSLSHIVVHIPTIFTLSNHVSTSCSCWLKGPKFTSTRFHVVNREFIHVFVVPGAHTSVITFFLEKL